MKTLKDARYLENGDKWLLAEEIPDIDFQFSQIWLSSFVNDLEKTIGTNYEKVMCVYTGGYNLKFYYGEKDSERLSQVILDKIVNKNFGEEINSNIRIEADKLSSILTRIDEQYLAKLDNSDFAELYEKLDAEHTIFYSWCWLPNAVDMFHPHYTDHLKGILQKHSDKIEVVNEALVALSFSEEKSFVQEEDESLLKLAIQKKTCPENTEEYERMLKEHHKKYFYLKHLWVGKDGVSTIDEYQMAVDKILESDDPSVLLAKEEEKWKQDKAKRDLFEKQLNLTEEEIKLFRTYAEFGFTKAYRRQVQLFWAYKMDFIFNELAKRFDISFMESRFLLPEEIKRGLMGGRDGLEELAKDRIEHAVYYAEKNLEIVVTGDECGQFESYLESEEEMFVSEFEGQVACTGFVKGPVKIVNTVSDIAKVEDGDVLISIATNPDILPAMKKATAFVTEQGGVTSHAAIVSREMRKPCVIGTKIATKVLKDGDLVEVDANKGVIKILERAHKK